MKLIIYKLLLIVYNNIESIFPQALEIDNCQKSIDILKIGWYKTVTLYKCVQPLRSLKQLQESCKCKNQTNKTSSPVAGVTTLPSRF